MPVIRLALALCLVAAPVLAADQTFTKEEIQAAYALGRADALREQLAASPAAKSLAEKMKPPPAATPKKR